MAKRRAESGEEKGNWLDTYADMVTLLLCFFVLLYSASSVDETKWQYIYLSILYVKRKLYKPIRNGRTAEE